MTAGAQPYSAAASDELLGAATQPYSFRLPTAIVAGPGVAAQAGAEAAALGATRVLVVTDPGVAATPHLRTVTDSLAGAGLRFDVFDRVAPDPSIEVVEHAIPEVRAGSYDGFIALGGGSSIDVTKGLRLLSECGGVLRDYAPGDKVPGALRAPFIAISTTAGTGSQVSFGAVFSDTARGTKFTIGSPRLAPTLALNDPLVTVGAPPRVTASAGMDALAHAVESYLSVRANPIADALALEAVRVISRALPRVMTDGGDLVARDAMLMASTIAIVPGYNCGLGVDHAVAMPLCTLFDLPHGLVVGMLLSTTMAYNFEPRIARLARLAEALGAAGPDTSPRDAATAAVDAVRHLAQQCGLPTRLRDVGVDADSLGCVATLTMESFQVPNNPRPMTSESVAAMLATAF